MKTSVLVVLLIIFAGIICYGQKIVLKPDKIANAVFHDKTKPLREIVPIPPDAAKSWEGGIIRNNFTRREYKQVFKNLVSVKDPVLQNYMGTKQLQQNFVINYDGMNRSNSGNAIPPDTDGDVGPDNYFQMLNLAFQIFDKNGNSLYGPTANNTIFNGWDDGQPWDNTNDGDPIVLYDEQADRWMVSHFSLPNWTGPYYILIAYSTTGDPLGSYNRYAFQFSDLPDYPKYGIWNDGIYMTLNSNSDNAVVFERDSMLTGGNARMITFTLPDYPGSGFKSALAADCDGTFPPLGTPNYLIYYNDDAWGSYPNDHLRIWEFKTRWDTTTNSTLALTNTLNTESFDTDFGDSWDNIPQPNGQKLDGILQAVMFRVQYRKFPAYNAMVLNYTVDADGTDHAGIRWYELREEGSGWYIYQQGTYAPDGENRWMGSIAMDINGNIGLAYSVSSSTVFPSLRFTGHTLGAPLGEMNITETEIVAGAGSQSGTNRYGDYAALTLDPVDNKTFWFTSEYIPTNGNWRTRIAAFKFDSVVLVPVDAGAISMVSPVTGTNLGNTENVVVKVANFGTDTISNLPVALIFNNNPVIIDTILISLAPAATYNHTFSQTVDMSVEGIYNFKIYTMLNGDTVFTNDTINVQVEHTPPAYCLASGGGNYEYISNVSLGTINQASAYSAYTDFTTVSTVLNIGTIYPMNVTLGDGYQSDELIVWIDWNHNLDFNDAGEKIILGTGIGPYSGNIVPPNDALLGSTMMRIRVHDTANGPNNTPCGSSDYGEVEDYTIVVDASVSSSVIFPDEMNFTIYPNPANTSVDVSLLGIGYNLKLQIVNVLGEEIYSEYIDKKISSYNKMFDISELKSGLYFVRIRLENENIIQAKKLIIVR